MTWEGRSSHLDRPVFNTVRDAVEETADASMILCQLPFVKTYFEAASAGIKVIACNTEGIPTFDMLAVKYCFRKNYP